MGLECILDCLDDVIPAVFAKRYVIAEHGARAHIDDYQEPYPFHLEFVCETEWIPHDNLEPDIEPMTIKFDDLVRPDRRRCVRAVEPGQALKVRGAG
ncbi:hypothetical protein PPGU16_81720 (plasmid) [Paraburkholderia largidicola]|uniref:Uncharacterized protein n=1 Tax=Paraburkholderia largidicola TaxID=3014751 RepID=A0A7I8C399_9BURK|nr:hypothetical protein PPGU16_81720 [Paraburkholderia sp. PGU16]